MNDKIIIKGAKEHNLKNINLEIPRDKMVVITGLSGSGKSSLAFDTLYAEGQRRYVESLSSYARQFLGIMEKPDVETIEGLSPAISIDQKTTSKNPRSTVGTVTEIYDYIRLLYARIVSKYIGQYYAELGGCDAICFTAGVGENAAYLRRLIIDNVSRAFGVFLDEELNSIRSDENRVISHQYSQIKVMVIPTNEEVMIARDTVRLLDL